MSVNAIAGMLFTSVLIGIITGAIEEKLTDLKRGNSAVIESDHVVVLGFHPGEDAQIIKTILAVSRLLQDEHITDVRIHAILSTNHYNFPKSLADAHNISIIKTNEIMAKIIAHSCTQTGLSETFREVFNYEGSEFHLISCPELAQRAEHIVILSDHNKTVEDADMDTMFLLLNFRDVRLQHNLHFNITVQMCTEHNQRLASGNDHTDFLVSSSMSSLFLAQLAENPELIEVFRDLLDNEGTELYLKNVGDLNLCGTHTVLELRQIALSCGYILLGYLDAEKQSHFTLSLEQTIHLTPDCNIIVLSEN